MTTVRGLRLAIDLKDPPFPQTDWETFDIEISEAAGHAGVHLNFTFSTYDANGNDFAGWYIDDVVVDSVRPPADVLSVAPTDLAPSSVQPGDSLIVMGSLELSASANSATVFAITLDLTGSPPRYQDVAWVSIVADNGNGAFDLFGDATVGGSEFFGSNRTFLLSYPLLVAQGKTERLWVVFEISESAQVGNFLGFRIADSSQVFVHPPDAVASNACPFDTYVPGGKTEVVTTTMDTVTVTPVDQAPSSAARGMSSVLMASLDVQVASNQARLSSVLITLSGMPPQTADISRVTLWLDLGDGVFDPTADSPLSVGSLSSGPVTLPAYDQPILPTLPRRFYVTLDIAASATLGDYVGIAFANASAFEVRAPDVAACSGCPLDTYAPGIKTVIDLPPIRAYDLTVNAFVPGTSGIAHIVGDTPTLAWRYFHPTGAPQTAYELRVGSTFGMDDVWASGPVTGDATSATYGGPALADGTSYHASVRVSAGTNWSAWSNVEFRTNTPPTTPALTGPPELASGATEGLYNFRWAPATDAEGDGIIYRWSVSMSADFSILARAGQASGTAVVVDLLDRGGYFFRLRAEDGWESGPYSEPYLFWNPPELGEGAVLVVHVTAGGTPVAGAAVRLVARDGTILGQGGTDANGSIRFTGIPLGSYSLRVTASGYIDWAGTVELLAPDTTVEIALVSSAYLWLLLIPIILGIAIFAFVWRRRRRGTRPPNQG